MNIVFIFVYKFSVWCFVSHVCFIHGSSGKLTTSWGEFSVCLCFVFVVVFINTSGGFKFSVFVCLSHSHVCVWLLVSRLISFPNTNLQ